MRSHLLSISSRSFDAQLRSDPIHLRVMNRHVRRARWRHTQQCAQSFERFRYQDRLVAVRPQVLDQRSPCGGHKRWERRPVATRARAEPWSTRRSQGFHRNIAPALHRPVHTELASIPWSNTLAFAVMV
jgi:hypothetical protein